MGDSFYEYLLKAYLQSGKEDEQAKHLYFDAIDVSESSAGGLLVLNDWVATEYFS